MQTSKIALAVLATAGAAFAQCNALTSATLRTYNPWAVSFYYPSANGDTLNQYVDLDVSAPLTINEIYSTTYSQGAGSTTPPDQTGNVAEVRIYTTPTSHVGQEGTPANWTHVATGEMLIVAWNGDCVTSNFKDPTTGNPFTFVLPAGQYGFCIEYIPTTWQGTTSLPQTNVPLLNPGEHSVIGVDPANYPDPLQSDQFISLSNGDIQTSGWQQVDPTGVLIPNPAIGGTFNDQPNLAFNYTPDPAAGASLSIGPGCYDLPFMKYEQIPANTQPIDVANTAYTAILTPSANGGFYTISNGGIPYIPPGAGATNLTQGGGAATPVANSSGNLDDATFGFTPQFAINIPSPNGGLAATELGINTNGKIYFDTVPPTDTSFNYNGANYASIVPFRDLAAQWAVFNTDLDPTSGGDIYVQEPSPNLGGVMVWWDNVPNWPAVAGQTMSFSIEFTQDGSVVNIAYGPTLYNEGGGNDAIIGFSAGNGEPEGGLTDWSAIPALPGAELSGDGSSAPTLALDNRPVENTNVNLVMGNLPEYPAGVAHVGIFALNTTVNAQPVDLGSIGMPGCPFYPGLGNPPILITAFEDPSLPGEITLAFPLPAGAAGFDAWVQGRCAARSVPAERAGSDRDERRLHEGRLALRAPKGVGASRRPSRALRKRPLRRALAFLRPQSCDGVGARPLAPLTPCEVLEYPFQASPALPADRPRHDLQPPSPARLRGAPGAICRPCGLRCREPDFGFPPDRLRQRSAVPRHARRRLPVAERGDPAAQRHARRDPALGSGAAAGQPAARLRDDRRHLDRHRFRSHPDDHGAAGLRVHRQHAVRAVHSRRGRQGHARPQCTWADVRRPFDQQQPGPAGASIPRWPERPSGRPGRCDRAAGLHGDRLRVREPGPVRHRRRRHGCRRRRPPDCRELPLRERSRRHFVRRDASGSHHDLRGA